jgi:SAM-dependent methyltransferase
MRTCLDCGKCFVSADWRCPACGFAPAQLGQWPAFAASQAQAADGFKSEFFADVARSEAGSFWFRSRNRLLSWGLQRFSPLASNFLEIGCGTGFVLSSIHKAFPRLALTGSDVLVQALSFAQERLPDVAFLQMDACRIPFASEFDLVGAFDVLEHIQNDDLALQQIHRSLKPDGVLLLTVPQHPFLWSPVDDYSLHNRRYTRIELMRKLQQAQFRVTYVTSFVSLLLPIMMLSRFRERLKSRDFDPSFEQKFKFLDKTFERMMNLELHLIQRGFAFPFGGSLFLAASRLEISPSSC